MANIIDSLNFDGTTEGIFTLPYGTCATAADTVAKVATATNFVLETGARIAIKFTYANSVASPTLNVNSSGAKAIYWHGAALASSQYWQAGAILDFVYNGTQWELIGVAKDNNTTYNAADSALGLVKSGGDVSISSGVITVKDDSHNHTIANVDNLQTTLDGKAASSHTHNYAGSSSAGGAATSANKVNSSLTVKLNGGTTEGTNMFTFNGSAAKAINVTPSAIGAAASSHTHDDSYYTESEIDEKVSAINTSINGKADSSHTHTIANVTNLQSSLDGKQATITGGASTITGSNLTTSRALISNDSGKVAVSAVTSTELGYLDGVTSNVQTQLDGLASNAMPKSGGAFTGGIEVTGGSGKVSIWSDNEGGNIQINSETSNNDYWQMDALNGDFRIYHGDSTQEADQCLTFDRNGVIAPSGGYAGGSFTGEAVFPKESGVRFMCSDGGYYRLMTAGTDNNLYLAQYDANGTFLRNVFRVDTSTGTIKDGLLMPKSGGTFTGNVVANDTNRAGRYIRGNEVKDSAGTTQVSTNSIVFVRK